MSMEEAIKDHASALRELAAAIHNMAGDGVAAMQIRNETARASAPIEKRADKRETVEVPVLTKEQAEQVPGEPVKEEGPTAGPDADLEQAVEKVEEAAVAEQAPMDYTRDVRPVLLKLAKAKGQPELKTLLNKFGAATGDKLDAKDYAAIVADANELIAA